MRCCFTGRRILLALCGWSLCVVTTIVFAVSATAGQTAVENGGTRGEPKQSPTVKPTDTQANRKLVQAHWDAVNRGDMVAAAEFFAEHTRNHGRPVGRVRVLAILKDIQTTFPDVHFAPIEYVAEGEWVVVRGIFSGTHRGIGRLPVNGGMLVGVQPTGRHFEVQHIHMLQVSGGKIVDHYANRDDLKMMQQLGLLPTSGSTKR